jgi:carbonic anhydrase
MQQSKVTPQDALARLRAGNERFVAGTRSLEAMLSPMRRHELVDGQSPFATILTCSDSRVPVELLFDQGLGDLFVIRVAGNVVAPSLVGSVEYAAAVLGCELVVVMGHSRCGAVKTTLDVLRGQAQVPSENIRDIVDRIRPSISSLAREQSGDPNVLDRAIAANVHASVDALRHGSPLLEQRIKQGTLAVIGATYDIGSGLVDFSDLPEGVSASIVPGGPDAADGRPRAIA